MLFRSARAPEDRPAHPPPTLRASLRLPQSMLFCGGHLTLHFRPSAATSISFQRRTRLHHVSLLTGFLQFNIAHPLPNHSELREISVMTLADNSGLAAISRSAAVLSRSSPNRQTSAGIFPRLSPRANMLRVRRPALRHGQCRNCNCLLTLAGCFFPIALVRQRVMARDKVFLNSHCDSQDHFTGNL